MYLIFRNPFSLGSRGAATSVESVALDRKGVFLGRRYPPASGSPLQFQQCSQVFVMCDESKIGSVYDVL